MFEIRLETGTHGDGSHIQIPNPPYPACNQCGGTLVPIIVPGQSEHHGAITVSDASYSVSRDEYLAWKCSGCGRSISYDENETASGLS